MKSKKNVVFGMIFLGAVLLGILLYYIVQERLFYSRVYENMDMRESRETDRNLFDNEKEFLGKENGELLDRLLTAQAKVGMTDFVEVSQDAIKDFPRFEQFGVPMVSLKKGRPERFDVVTLPEKELNVYAYLRKSYDFGGEGILYKRIEYLGKNEFYKEYRIRIVDEEEYRDREITAYAFRIIVPLYLRETEDGNRFFS